jgi:RNA polymerase sigma-70 factor (sigma-E family)
VLAGLAAASLVIAGMARPYVVERRGSGQATSCGIECVEVSVRLNPELESSFSVFVDSHGQQLLRQAWLLAGDRDAGQDLFQQVLMKAARHWPRISVDNPVAYCRRALTTTAIDAARRSRWREITTGRMPERETADATAVIDSRDEVLRLLKALPPRQRAVIVLRYWADLSEQQIAAELGISTGTVKSTTSRALASLRDAAPTITTHGDLS